MKKVYVRYYDKENLGDDLFLKIVVDRYQDDFILRKSYDAGKFVASSDVTVNRESFSLSKIDKILSRFLGTRFIMALLQIMRSDLLLYVGGSLFMDNTSIAYWSRERKFYEQIKIPYYILGTNVGPVKTKRFIDILHNIFTGAQDVCFRDKASYALFKDVSSVRVATDIAFTLDTKHFDSVTQEKRIVFSVIDAYKKFDIETAAKYEQEIIKLVKKSIENGYRATFISFCKYEGDESAVEQILAKMDNDLRKKVDKYMYRGDLGEALTVLAKSETVVASRFHASILGLVFGKKILPMAYSDKTTNILNDMNFEGPVIDIRKIDEFDGSTFDFSGLKINDVSAQKTLAEKQFQELDKVLTRRK